MSPPAHESIIPETLARKKSHLFSNLTGDDRRIEMAGMVGRDQKRALAGEIFLSDYFASKPHRMNDAGQIMKETVERFHGQVIGDVRHGELVGRCS